MKISKNTMLVVGLFMAATISSDARAAAESKNIKVTIKDIQVEDSIYTPYYEADTGQDHQQGASARWIRLGVYFTTEGGWIDELDVTQMAIKNTDGKKPGVVLSETVHYNNLDPGDHYVYVYLHPSYVERYEIDAYDLDSAAIITIDGKELAWKESTKHAKAGWSKNTDESMEKGYLLNHAETPFWFINYDFKEIIRR